MSGQEKAQALYLGKHEHGRPNAYNKGCRCADCRAANTRRCREQKARAKERLLRGEVQIKHGSSAYANWGCRCSICTDAHVKAHKPYVARWRASNPEKVREASARWRARNSEKVTAGTPERNAKIREVQGFTLERATRRYYVWTGPELEIAGRDDLSSREVALLIGRTYDAVRNMRRKLRGGAR